MNRRAFLRWLGGTAAGAVAASTLDVDRLLWLQGEKTIFLPPVAPVPLGLTIGDIFTIQGRYAINPMTGLDTPHLQSYVITGNVSCTAGIVSATANIHPPLDRPFRSGQITPLLTGIHIPLDGQWIGIKS